MKTFTLETKRFKTLDEAEGYMKGFSVNDLHVNAGDIQLTEQGVKIRGQELPLTNTAWAQFCSAVAPGASKFVNAEDTPQELANYILNYMLAMNWEDKRTVRVETDPRGRSYVKAYLAGDYAPYSNLQFIDFIKSTAQGKCLRPTLHNGVFSVNFVTDLVVHSPEKKRDVKLGAAYKNSEVGKHSVKQLPFTFDSFCENGCVFSQSFLQALTRRVIHRGIGIENRVNENLHIERSKEAVEILGDAYDRMAKSEVTQLYYKYVSHQVVQPFGVMTQSDFANRIPFQAKENRFQLMNRITLLAHKGESKAELDTDQRLGLEELAGKMVEESILS